jgi:hypothetical protein
VRTTRRTFLAAAAAALSAGASGCSLFDGTEDGGGERPGTSGRAGAAAPDVYTGVATRTVRADTSSAHRHNPWLRLLAAYVPWGWIEPRRGVWNWRDVDRSIADARDGGYKVILRIECGHRTPGWVYADRAPVEPIRAVHRATRPITLPVPWDENLALHYRELLAAVERYLASDDGRGGRKADHVYFMPIAMPTEVGTEMAMGYGGDPRNRAAWDALAPEWERRRLVSAAWRRAVELHLEVLRSAPSCIAFGPIWDDDYATAKAFARELFPAHADRLWAMTTNLRCPPGGGAYARWSGNAAAAMRTAADAGAVVGFQTASLRFLADPALFRCACEDGLRYGMRFLETSPELVARHGPYLRELQARIATA